MGGCTFTRASSPVGSCLSASNPIHLHDTIGLNPSPKGVAADRLHVVALTDLSVDLSHSTLISSEGCGGSFGGYWGRYARYWGRYTRYWGRYARYWVGWAGWLCAHLSYLSYLSGLFSFDGNCSILACTNLSRLLILSE